MWQVNKSFLGMDKSEGASMENHPSSPQINKGSWKIWLYGEWKSLPKMRKLCSLNNKVHIFKRINVKNPLFPICQTHPQSEEHLLLLCLVKKNESSTSNSFKGKNCLPALLSFFPFLLGYDQNSSASFISREKSQLYGSLSSSGGS